MDEFANRTEANFREVRAEMHAGFDRIERRFDILYGALATGFVAAVVQHFIG
jgi:hypothetical protein